MVWGQVAARGIEDLVARVKRNEPDLSSLHIMRQRRFNHEDVASLCEALESNSTLKELIAINHTLEPRTAGVIGKMLEKNSTLSYLYIGDNKFGDEELASLVATLEKNSGLEHLNLENKSFGLAGAGALGRALSLNRGLRRLTLAGNGKLGDEGIEALLSAAPQTTWACPLQRLDFQGVGVSSVGLLAALKATAAGASSPLAAVSRLDLSGNPLGAGPSAEMLLALLATGEALEDLILAQCQLGEEAAAGIAVALRRGDGRRLRRLVLNGNRIGGQGIRDLAGALAYKVGTTEPAAAALLDLDLAHNPDLTDDDLATLGEALLARRLSSDGGAFSLDISGTQVGPQTLARLSQLPRLGSLILSGCQLSAHVGALTAAMKPPSAAPAAAADEPVPTRESAGAATSATNGVAPQSSLSPPMPAVSSASTSGSGFSDLKHLALSGCGLIQSDITALFKTLSAGGAAALTCLEIGVNPGCLDNDAVADDVDSLRDARPELEVHWRNGDMPSKA